jgi:hypothetical protein
VALMLAYLQHTRRAVVHGSVHGGSELVVRLLGPEEAWEDVAAAVKTFDVPMCQLRALHQRLKERIDSKESETQRCVVHTPRQTGRRT